MMQSDITTLVVEDNPEYVQLLELALTEHGAHAIHLETVDRLSLGRQRLLEAGIDVVLLDLSLPDSQGLDTLISLQSTAPDVPIIVLTGLEDDRLGLEVIARGAQDYLVKSHVDYYLLTRTLRYAIERKQAEQALRASEARYRSLFEQSRDAVYVANGEGKLIEINQAGLSLMGYTREEMLSLDFEELCVDPRDWADFHQLLQERGFVENYETKLRGKEGAELDCLLSGTIWRADDGAIIGYQGIIRDISVRRRMEEKLHDRHRSLHLIISSMPNALLTLDEEDRLVAYFIPPHFPPVLKTEKLSPRESIAEALPAEMAVKVMEALKFVSETAEICILEHMEVLDEWPFFFKIKVSPIVDANEVLIVIDDITDLKRAEETIRRYATELEAGNKELDAFSHTVAHDLKAPLGNILMAVSTVQAEEQDHLSPMSMEFLRDAEKTVFIMSEMVDNLLLFARLRDATELIKVVNMTPVIQDALARLRKAIAKRGISVDVQPDLPSVMGHAPWLGEVLANLIGNAVKYVGKNNPTPRIAIRAHRQDEVIRYEVQDNGLGIALADQAKLFEMFARFHRAEAKGAGLGLSIVQRIITKLDGEVGVESAPGQGSTFWFTLPAPPDGSW